MLRRLIGEDVELEWNRPPGDWPLRIDPGQVDQVLANLAINARDAMPGGGRLRIELHAGHPTLDAIAIQPWIELRVSDTGEGIDPAILPHVFEPFVTTKAEGSGTGLGLATVYGIVSQNGGRIRVDSTPGIGSTFRIELPRADGVAERPEPVERPPTPARSSEVVLVVEDEAAILSVTATTLRRQGYQVLTASNGLEALQVLEAHGAPVDVLVTDIVMPGMDGRELHRRVASRWPGVRVLYVSGYTADVLSTHGVVPDDVHFLTKPFTAAEFTRRVREALDA